uniref:Exc-7 n=1 Tax=Pristionchus pacificus TaxID=54126 RepID=A0A2A6B7Q2_PRIPA|eukprot:PDM61912.1 exc-7 [Pristionchus pacificus]
MGSQFRAKVSTSPKIALGESSTNLIINYLPQTMNQEEVRALFASIGEIESCKLVRDKMSGQSLGYGFVNYVKDEDASRAVSSFNGLRLQNKTIKVLLASFGLGENGLMGRGKTLRQGRNLGISVVTSASEGLENRLSSRNGLSKGVGFVRFDKKEEAEVAIEKLNGATPAGCADQITVKFANNPANNPTKNAIADSAAMATAAQTLLATNPLAAALAPRIALPAVSAGCGPIRTTGGARGAMRYNPLAAAAALPLGAAPATGLPDLLQHAALLQQMQAMQNAGFASLVQPSLYGASVLPSPSAPALSSAGYSLLVQGLGAEMDEAVLWALFAPFGSVLSMKIVREPGTAKCRGYALVTMSTYEESLTAAAGLNKSQLAGRTLQVREADRATALAILAQDTQAQLGLLPTVGWAYEHTA